MRKNDSLTSFIITNQSANLERRRKVIKHSFIQLKISNNEYRSTIGTKVQWLMNRIDGNRLHLASKKLLSVDNSISINQWMAEFQVSIADQ